MQRRDFLKGATALAGGLSLSGCAGSGLSSGRGRAAVQVPPLARIDARVDRIIATDVCTRPFRAQGPRIEVQRLGSKHVVHNYGHGGSGWSLSWGSAALARDMALSAGNQQIAVIGCGAIGLTTALEAQRAGMAVTIYARERPPYVRSSYATGIWSPESRIVSSAHAGAFADSWRTMTLYSYRRFQSLLGLDGAPVEWTQMYNLSDRPFAARYPARAGEPEYPSYSRDLLPNLTPKPVAIPADLNPFSSPHVKRHSLLMFNISEYTRLLLARFYANGGRLISADFKSERDFSGLDEATVINCTGYGARELLGDDSVIPVRGQTCKLIPQPEVNYGIWFWDRQVSVYPRRDGLLVQAQAEGDFGNGDALLNLEESTGAVQRLAEIVAGMKTI